MPEFRGWFPLIALQKTPVHFRGLFNENVPQSLIDCIGDLLRYNPKYRMTSSQCIEHEYFHETLPHLQQTPPLPRIPFSQGQPLHRITPPQPHELTAPPRQVPPSHSHHESPRPAFANGDMRTLPPPIGTPDQTRNIFPMHGSSGTYEPSALVNQLRQLDLPTEDLSSYGHRPPPSPVASSVYTFGGDATVGPAQRTQAWAEEARRASVPYVPPTYDAHSAEALNSSHYAHVNQSQAKVTAFMQEQQHVQVYEDGTPRQIVPGQNNIPPMPHIPPMDASSSAAAAAAAASSSKLAALTVGKKKKWGLSSVFSRDDKSSISLPPVDEHGYASTVGSASLKRTQSGSERSSAVQPLQPVASVPSAPSPVDDPKKAKKEAELARREADKAKREAAARMQKERARAVMLKRQQLLAEQSGVKDPQVEHVSGFTVAPEAKPAAPAQPALGQGPHRLHHSSSRDLRQTSAHPMSQSATSVRSHESRLSVAPGSLHSGHSQSHPSLPLREPHEMSSRHKARRRDEDDDHSMSNFDQNSLRSRSVLTVGTIDSE